MSKDELPPRFDAVDRILIGFVVTGTVAGALFFLAILFSSKMAARDDSPPDEEWGEPVEVLPGRAPDPS